MKIMIKVVSKMIIPMVSDKVSGMIKSPAATIKRIRSCGKIGWKNHPDNPLARAQIASEEVSMVWKMAVQDPIKRRDGLRTKT